VTEPAKGGIAQGAKRTGENPGVVCQATCR